MPLSYSFIPTIENIIRNIEKEYQRNQGLILTESDLGSLIYCKLRGILLSRNPRNDSGLQWRMRTQDQHIFACPVHLEAPWYDDDGRLTVRPDITILEPGHLSILHSYGDGLRLPSKQFAFAGKAIVLELKFIRSKKGITPHVLKQVAKDFGKIDELRRNHNPGTLYCLFVVFNKTDNRCIEFEQYLSGHMGSDWYKYIYSTGNVISR